MCLCDISVCKSPGFFFTWSTWRQHFTQRRLALLVVVVAAAATNRHRQRCFVQPNCEFIGEETVGERLDREPTGLEVESEGGEGEERGEEENGERQIQQKRWEDGGWFTL